MMMEAIHVYRTSFRPSERLAEPYLMLGYNIFAADTDEEAQLLASSMQQAFVNLRTGKASKLPPPVPDYVESLPPSGRAMLDHVLSCSAIGAPETVERQVRAFIERTGADELMITSQIFDHEARLRSYELAARLIGSSA
jgi:alkanesulfonate monooxygenase SsuD/methylene tetrahydromethanopterin reductase-like flavin-dependent oxidoreductase (luciferase family)